MQYVLKQKVYFLVIVLLLCGRSAFSASLEMTQAFSDEVGRGQEISVDLLIDTDAEIINALEGKLVIDPAFSVKEIQRGNSFISLWTEAPSLEDNTLSFAGIIPGGFRGKNAYLFTLVLSADKLTERAILEAQDFSVFLHDGEGSAIPVDTTTLEFAIKSDIPLIETPLLSEDVNAPELFRLMITQNPSLFDGDYALIFSAQDKESGIAQYEVREMKYRAWSSRGVWELASSPYRLQDQSLRSFIYVRAIDNKGNARIAMLPPEHFSMVRHIPSFIILFIIALYFVIKKYVF